MYQFYKQIFDISGQILKKKDKNELKLLDGRLWAYVQRDSWIINRLLALRHYKDVDRWNSEISQMQDEKDYFQFDKNETTRSNISDKFPDFAPLKSCELELFFGVMKQNNDSEYPFTLKKFFRLKILEPEKNSFDAAPFRHRSPRAQRKLPVKKQNDSKITASDEYHITRSIINNCLKRQLLLRYSTDSNCRPLLDVKDRKTEEQAYRYRPILKNK